MIISTSHAHLDDMFYRTLRLLPLEHRRKIIVTCPLQTTHSFSGGHRVISLLPLTDILHRLQGQTLQSTARNSLTTKKPLEIFPHFVKKNNQLFPILVVHSSSITRPYVPRLYMVVYTALCERRGLVIFLHFSISLYLTVILWTLNTERYLSAHSVLVEGLYYSSDWPAIMLWLTLVML